MKRFHSLINAVYFFALIFFVYHASAQSFLRTNGLNIVDETGNKILLQGVGLGNWMLPEGYMWKFGERGDRPRRIEKIVADLIGRKKAGRFWKSFRRNFITEADVKRIAELGYNSVRPALNSRLFLAGDGTDKFLDEGFELLDNLISWCGKYHLYVVIDMHGAPGGQTGQNIDDSPNNEPELFMNPKNEERLVKLWVKLAERYKDEPVVAAFDLLNEPLPERTGAADRYKNQLVPIYEKLIKAVRAVDQRHMFTVEGYNWSNNWSLFDKPLDSNIFHQFHYYCWDRPDNLNDISYFLDRQKELNVPVWVGETGEKNNVIYFGTTQYFEKNNIGWSFWPWKKMDTRNTPYSIKPPGGWGEISEYSRNGGTPAAINPERIFNELLENIKLENCEFFPDVVNAMFRRIPLKVEAENYGHDGYMRSYFVKDTLYKSSTYRKKEPVRIKLIGGGQYNSEQFVELADGEWTAYSCKSPEESAYQVSLKIKAVDPPAKIHFVVNGESTELKIEQTEWTELKIQERSFKAGDNEFKVIAKQGGIHLDWIDIH